jgi:hypothetical protein
MEKDYKDIYTRIVEGGRKGGKISGTKQAKEKPEHFRNMALAMHKKRKLSTAQGLRNAEDGVQ